VQISKSVKFSAEVELGQFAMRTVTVTLSHEELGLAEPSDVDSLYATSRELSKHAEALIALELIRVGKLNRKQVAERLRRWAPSP
jgi:hypothetical protein